jgi:hypothetical protein
MDLNQRKLNKSEWESIEIPVSESELNILKLIQAGYHNVDIRMNYSNTLLSFLKVEYSEKMEDYIYNRYLKKRVDQIEHTLIGIIPDYKCMKLCAKNTKPNSSDRIRLERFDEDTIQTNDIYETTLLTHIEQILSNIISNNPVLYHYHYFTLYKLIRNNVFKLNAHIHQLTNVVLDLFAERIQKLTIIENACNFIEKNESLLKYGDLVLYEHQKEIFTLIKQDTPKLILYMAPTGTGKTLTPIALSEKKKIIFVCAARHVGLALARAAISIRKKIAFAFGCSSSDDIRLHYFAATEFTKNKRSGGIGKVDNSMGDNVEIMICDIKSYLPAMYYMLAFFKKTEIVTYWDEPTITMDYADHEFHATIRKNWKDNIIPTIILSSATLPKATDLTETIPDYLRKFPRGEICNIVSHDCKKSIPIINKDGYVVLPHYLTMHYAEMLKIATHCSEYLTLLRYFDLKEVSEFITFVNTNEYSSPKMAIDRHFEDLSAINMTTIKVYYVHLLRTLKEVHWTIIHSHFMTLRRPRILENDTVDEKGAKIKKAYSVGPGVEPSLRHPCSSAAASSLNGAPIMRMVSEQPQKQPPVIKGTSGAYITTKDAYTLTDGPTIFISNDIEKIAKFCVQQANIPSVVMDEIMKNIEYNNAINAQIHEIEVEIDDAKEAIEQTVKNKVDGFHNGQKINSRSKSGKDPKKLTRDVPEEMLNKGSLNRMTEKINTLRSMIKRAVLNDTFIPNKKSHLDKWAPNTLTSNAFTSMVDEKIVSDIMALNGVDNLWKVLLMMGIGVFVNHDNITYTEIMKKLADEQKLYMIIASSDYIYGTNYQFCHGYLSKDLSLTQEKVIQAMGRIGRNNIQQSYTIRSRDDSQILKLFTNETEKPEVINMNILFNSLCVRYEEGVYIESTESLVESVMECYVSDDDDDSELAVV